MATVDRFGPSSTVAASSSPPPELILDDAHCQLSDPDPKETPLPLSKPKSGTAGRGKKKIQRSPGVAKLERLCIQEHVTRLSGPDEAREIRTLHPVQIQLAPIYSVPVQRFAGAAGVWVELPQPGAGFCYMSGVVSGSPLPSGTLVQFDSRSLQQEQYSLGRRRIATSGNVYQQELPLNKSVLRVPEYCELVRLT